MPRFALESETYTCDSALIDGRVGWTILEGQAMAIGYASEEEIKHWGTFELGDTPSLREKVADLYRNGIRTKTIFVKPQSTVFNT